MTNKTSLALAALLVVGTASSVVASNPEDALTEQAMVSKTVWMGAKCVLAYQFLKHMKGRVLDVQRSVDTSDEANEVGDMLVSAMVAGWFSDELKSWAKDVSAYVWDKVEPIADQLPEPVRSVVCNN